MENIQSGFRATGIVPFNPHTVLDKLTLSMVVKTPPPSRGSASIPSSQLCTPHTVRQVHRKASSFKKLLKNGSRSPTSPSKRALDEFIKGCEQAIYNTSLLANENCNLRAAIKNDRQKKDCSKRQITPIEGLSFQEARDLISLRNKQLEVEGDSTGRSALPTSTILKRAPLIYSECNIKGHTRRGCPNR